jgi:hypothetical protein
MAKEANLRITKRCSDALGKLLATRSNAMPRL